MTARTKPTRTRRNRRGRPGLAPGRIERTATERTVNRLVTYGIDLLDERDIDETRLERPTGERGVWWLDITDPAGSTLQSVGQLFGLHPLALEDAAGGHQRPKVEVHPDHLFVILRALDLEDPSSNQQIALFVGQGWLVTVHERPVVQFQPVLDRIRAGRGRIRQRGADYLAYALVDAVIDRYFPALDGHTQRLETLEASLLDVATDRLLAEVMATRRELARIRRAARPTRDVVDALMRADLINPETGTYLRDCSDHIQHINDTVEQLREQASHLMEVHLALSSHRMNEVMKVLTIIATIFIPLSFVAGLYGMNFDTASAWNMPELRWRYGYPFALGLMAAMTLGLLWFFRRRGWLRRPDSTPVTDDDSLGR